MNDSVAQRGRELFVSGYCCAEASLLAIAESKGIHSELIPKIATGFCGGVARTRGMCGALSGGIIAINLWYGRNTPDVSHDPNYAMIQKLLRTFQEQFGATSCYELLGCDLGTEEGRRYHKEHNLRPQCENYVQEATRLALGIIDAQG